MPKMPAPLKYAALAITSLGGLFPSICTAQQPRPVPPMPTMAAPAKPDHSIRGPLLVEEDQVGRKFLPAMQVPDSPPEVESLMQAEGDSEARMTLDSLLSLAAQHNPTLLQAQQQVNGTLGKALEAGLYPNPMVSYVADQIFVSADNGRRTPGEFQGATVQQEFVTAGKLKLSREKYLQRAKSAEWLAVAQQWKVCNDIRIHYWKSLGHSQIVGIRKEQLKSAEDDALTVRERYQLGQATRAHLHMSNVSIQKARLALLSAENQFQGEFRNLSSLTGVELEPQLLAGQFDGASAQLIDFNETLAKTYAESPELLAARAKWQADSITVQRERVQPIPNIIVKAGSGYDFETNQPVATAQVSVSVPIFDRNQGTIQQAEADLARQSAEVRRLELRLRQDLSDRYQNYVTALQHVVEYESVILPEAKAAYAEQLEAYRQNRQNWGDVLHSQRDYFDLREQYVENLIGWRSNEVLINGYLLHGGLDAAMSPTPPGHIDSVPKPR